MVIIKIFWINIIMLVRKVDFNNFIYHPIIEICDFYTVNSYLFDFFEISILDE